MTAPAVGDGGTETTALAFGKDPNRPLFLRLVHSLPARRAAEMADAANRDRFAREIAGALLPDYRVKVAYRLSGDGTPVFTFTISNLSLPEPDERAVVPQPGSHLLHIVDKSAIPVRALRNWHDVLRRDYIAQLFSYDRNDWDTHVMAGEQDWAAIGNQRRDGSYRSNTLKPPGDLKVYIQPMYDSAAKTPANIGVFLSAPPDSGVAFPDKAHCDHIIGTVKQALGTDYRVQTRYGTHDELTLEFYIFRSDR